MLREFLLSAFHRLMSGKKARKKRAAIAALFNGDLSQSNYSFALCM
jgi:hypothetical protein